MRSALRWASAYVANSISVGAATGLASAGVLRFANNAAVNWRNAANGANLGWVVDGSDLMTTTAGLVAPYLAPASTTGATVAVRYFRGTATAAPTTGTWLTGDKVPSADGNGWTCTAGGTPGTWVQDGSGTYATLAGAVATSNGGKEIISTQATATGATTVNMANGNVHKLTLTGNVTLTFSGATNGVGCSMTVYIAQDGTGSRTITWPTIKWAGGVAPTASTAASAIDIYTFFTMDGGTTWFGNQAGKGYA